MYVLLRDFVESCVGDVPELALERASFDAACNAIDVIMRAKKGLLEIGEAAALLEAALADFMQKHLAASTKRHARRSANDWKRCVFQGLVDILTLFH